MQQLTYAVVLVLIVGGRCQGDERRDVKCNNTDCGVHEICVTDGSGERCECMFGYIKTSGNLFCQPSFTERPLDKIIRINRLRGVLHELFEGDIKLNPDQRRAIDVYQDLFKWNILGKRNQPLPIPGIDTNFTDSLPDIPIQYWRLPVPVAFSPDVPDSVRRSILAIMEMEGHAFLRPYNGGDSDYIMVRKGPGCWSYVGRQGGMQEVAIDDGCSDRDTVLHLFFHAFGMWHEQNRADRDEYITLHPLNMEPDEPNNCCDMVKGKVFSTPAPHLPWSVYKDGVHMHRISKMLTPGMLYSGEYDMNSWASVNFHRYHLYEPRDVFYLNESSILNYTGHHLPTLPSSSPQFSDMEKYLSKHGNCSDLTYDICSLLHIGPFAYSKNGEPVFSPVRWRGPCGNDFQHDIDVLGCLYASHYLFEYHVGCFPPSSMVQMENGMSKTIGELMIGDTVMVMDEEGRVSYSDVNLMMHKLPRTPVEYIILETEDGLTLTMTKEHVVFVTSVWSFSAEIRMASKVEIGDYLFRPMLTNGSFVPAKVTAIRKQVITGAYAPTTLAGNIVVDGHLASSYAFVEDQSLAHGVFLPWRIGYHVYNTIFGKSLHEPASGLHWSLRALVSLYCRISDNKFCEDLLNT